MKLNFCVTQNIMFLICSWRTKACTRVKAWPVRSKVARGLVSMFSLK